jgi:hypothetical protein
LHQIGIKAYSLLQGLSILWSQYWTGKYHYRRHSFCCSYWVSRCFFHHKYRGSEAIKITWSVNALLRDHRKLSVTRLISNLLRELSSRIASKIITNFHLNLQRYILNLKVYPEENSLSFCFYTGWRRLSDEKGRAFGFVMVISIDYFQDQSRISYF